MLARLLHTGSQQGSEASSDDGDDREFDGASEGALSVHSSDGGSETSSSEEMRVGYEDILSPCALHSCFILKCFNMAQVP